MSFSDLLGCQDLVRHLPRGEQERIVRIEYGVEICLHKMPNLLGLDEIIIHSVGTEAECTQQNSPLHLGTKPLTSSFRVEISVPTIVAFSPRAVTHTIVFG